MFSPKQQRHTKQEYLTYIASGRFSGGANFKKQVIRKEEGQTEKETTWQVDKQPVDPLLLFLSLAAHSGGENVHFCILLGLNVVCGLKMFVKASYLLLFI